MRVQLPKYAFQEVRHGGLAGPWPPLLGHSGIVHVTLLIYPTEVPIHIFDVRTKRPKASGGPSPKLVIILEVLWRAVSMTKGLSACYVGSAGVRAGDGGSNGRRRASLGFTDSDQSLRGPDSDV